MRAAECPIRGFWRVGFLTLPSQAKLVLVVRLAAVDDDLSASLTGGEVHGVEVH